MFEVGSDPGKALCVCLSRGTLLAREVANVAPEAALLVARHQDLRCVVNTLGAELPHTLSDTLYVFWLLLLLLFQMAPECPVLMAYFSPGAKGQRCGFGTGCGDSDTILSKWSPRTRSVLGRDRGLCC